MQMVSKNCMMDENGRKRRTVFAAMAEHLTRRSFFGYNAPNRPVRGGQAEQAHGPARGGGGRRTNVTKTYWYLGAGRLAWPWMLTVRNHVLVWSIEKEIDDLSTTVSHLNLLEMKVPQEWRFTKSIEEVCKNKRRIPGASRRRRKSSSWPRQQRPGPCGRRPDHRRGRGQGHRAGHAVHHDGGPLPMRGREGAARRGRLARGLSGPTI